MKKYKRPKDAKLSIIIPAYNSEKWISPTLEYLWESLKQTTWKSIEILVVDDGSSDSTAENAKKALNDVSVRVLPQKNAGRLAARRKGLAAANGDYIFFLDSRVYTDKGSFKFLVQQMNKLDDAVVWNGHVELDRKGNPYARFWHVVAFLAWRRYFANPKLTHYGIQDFDYYPKGAGCFLAPKEVLLRAYKQLRTDFSDDKNMNDDTSLIRHIAGETDIYLSPDFLFTYNARSTLKGFIRHTQHRGVVFIDGYLMRGTRYFWPLVLYLTLLPLAVILTFFSPLLLLGIPIILALIFVASLVAGVNLADALGFIFVSLLFVPIYTLGLYQGLFMKLERHN